MRSPIFYFLFSICIYSAAADSFGQSLLPESPISSSLANANIAQKNELVFSLNPANLSADSTHALHAAIAYTPFVGGLQGANQSSAEAAYYSSLTHLSFSFGATSLSYSDIYSDIAFNLSLSRRFDLANNRNAATGIRLRYEMLGTTPNYPKLHFLFLDIGFSIDLTNEFTLGGAALNLLGEKYDLVNSQTEKLERNFLIGISYHPLKFPLIFLTSVEESSIQTLALHFGAEWDPVSFLAIRAGTSTDTGNITTGIGIKYAGVTFDAGSRFDKALGSIFSFGASGAW